MFSRKVERKTKNNNINMVQACVGDTHIGAASIMRLTSISSSPPPGEDPPLQHTYFSVTKYRSESWRLAAVCQEEYSCLRGVQQPQLEYIRGLWVVHANVAMKDGSSWCSLKGDPAVVR
jgi:hypothetical protein